MSLFPGATEIVAGLGLSDSLVGRSHECNWPPSVGSVPVVSASRIDPSRLDSRQIDNAVKASLASGAALYTVDAALLGELRPDIVLTQDLCAVCAVSGEDLRPLEARVFSSGARTIAGIADSVRDLASELGVPGRGEELAGEMHARIEAVRRQVAGCPKPRVFVAEWVDPPYACGHWIPEMVEAAGGVELLGVAGERSVQTTWEAVRAARPDLVIAAPCGFDGERSAREASKVDAGCRVVAVDADRYFVRPAPSVARGIEMLAGIFHGGEARFAP